MPNLSFIKSVDQQSGRKPGSTPRAAIVCLALSTALSACSLQNTPENAPEIAPAQTRASTTHVLRRQHAPALYELAYSAKQQAVFVASAGGWGDNARLSRVLRLAPDTLDLQLEIPLSAPGLGVTLDDDNNRLYVGNGTEASISVIDTQSSKLVQVIKVAEKTMLPDGKGGTTLRIPHGLRELVVDNAHHRLFAPGLWTDTTGVLYVVDTHTLTLEKTLPGFGFGPAGIALDTQAGKIYVANFQGQLFRVDTATLAVETTLDIAVDQPLNLVFDPKRKRLVAVDQGSPRIDHVRANLARLSYENRSSGNRIVVINPENGQIEHRVASGDGPVNLRLDTQRDLLYVTNRGSGTVTIHDANAAYRVIDTVALPDHPNSLSVDVQSGAVFVTVKNTVAEGNMMVPGGAESVVRLSR